MPHSEIRLHGFDTNVDAADLPDRFNDPFDYKPHPLCVAAAGMVRSYMKTRSEWGDEIAAGKMFGVLIVRDTEGSVGFLAAFSGNLAGDNDHPYFVPPVYDMLRPGDFFRREEAEISEINRRISELESAPERIAAIRYAAEIGELAAAELARAKETLNGNKARRAERRLHTDDPAELDAMIRESQYQKAEYRRLKQLWDKRISEARAAADISEKRISALRAERKRRSEALQMRLFEHFVIMNARGRTKNLCEIFAPTPQRTPPAGAGECAAPKLLQYAYANRLQPVAMAEFWLGRSPVGEIRHEGCYYPACRGKCGPILAFMLDGLDVERHRQRETPSPTVIYEDDSLAVVNKPAGMLSVKGKGSAPSVEEWARQRFTNAERTMVVHRLDMETSGIILVAKDLDTYRKLQSQFHDRTIVKRYEALLDGPVAADSGRIELALRPDPLDRPRQIADPEHGKQAVTEYRVTERRAEVTAVEFTPRTGRTHQLRVHSAHPLGLGAPIAGDALYGRPSSRLFLHASHIEFRHPATGETMVFDCESGF